MLSNFAISNKLFTKLDITLDAVELVSFRQSQILVSNLPLAINSSYSFYLQAYLSGFLLAQELIQCTCSVSITDPIESICCRILHY